MKARKRMAFLLALIIIVSGFSGCGSNNKGSSENKGSTDISDVVNNPPVGDGMIEAADTGTEEWENSIIKVGLAVDPAIFGPYQTTNKGRKETLPEIYETLAMVQGVGGGLQGIMAKDWYAVDGEENTYIVELYDYITDSAGNSITADDVVYCYTDAGASDFKRYLTYMDSIEKIDEYTLKFIMKSDQLNAFENMISRVYVVSEAAFKADPTGMTSAPVGTGPYDLVEYVEGSKVVLAARSDYWQTDVSKLCQNQYRNVKTIEYVIIPEAAQQAIALETGTIDVMNGMSVTNAANFIDKDGFTVSGVTGSNCRTIFFNCNEASVCSDLAVRQAILYAINNEGLLDGCLDGNGEVGFCFGNTSYSDVDESWKDNDYYSYNPEKAKQLLKEAGYESGLTVRMLTFTGELESSIANIIYAYLDQVGIKLEIMQYEEALVKTYMRDFTYFDMLIPQRSAATGSVVGAWVEKLSDTTYDDGLNYCGFQDAHLQTLLDTAYSAKTYSEETVTAVYEEMTDNAYAYGLFSELNFTVYNENLIIPCLDLDYWFIPGCAAYTWN